LFLSNRHVPSVPSLGNQPFFSHHQPHNRRLHSPPSTDIQPLLTSIDTAPAQGCHRRVVVCQGTYIRVPPYCTTREKKKSGLSVLPHSRPSGPPHLHPLPVTWPRSSLPTGPSILPSHSLFTSPSPQQTPDLRLDPSSPPPSSHSLRTPSHLSRALHLSLTCAPSHLYTAPETRAQGPIA
jgi:hypothetical protein